MGASKTALDQQQLNQLQVAPPDDRPPIRGELASTESTWLLRHIRTYPGALDQVRRVRAFLREALAGCPRVDDAVAVASELAANAILHSRSGVPGGLFTVRAEVNEGAYVWVAVEDEGGGWTAREIQSGHGLDLVRAIARPGHWGVSGGPIGRSVWARLTWPATERIERDLSPPAAAARPASYGLAERETLAGNDQR